MGEKKNSISTLLMVVGVIFIVVAGGIFVTTAWRYLPEFVKQLCLLVAAGGLFAGSKAVAKGGTLRKTETALYYLGTAFLGFFVLALLGGINTVGDMGVLPQQMIENLELFQNPETIYQQLNSAKLICAALVMLLPVACRVVSKESGFDFCMATILADSMLINFTNMMQSGFEVFILILTGMVLGFSVLDYRRKQSNESNSGLDLAIGISYLLHSVICIPYVGCVAFMDDVTMGLAGLLAIMVVAATSFTYLGRKEPAFRVLNSIAVFGCVFSLVKDINSVLEWTDDIIAVLFAAFIVNLVVMICMKRKEMYYIQLGFGMWISLIQIFDMADVCGAELETYVYYPFAVMLALACIALWKLEDDSRYLKVAGLQIITGFVLQLLAFDTVASKGLEFGVYLVAFFFLIVMGFVTIAQHVEVKVVKKILATIALVNGVFAMMAMSIDMVDISTGYYTEWNCAAIGLGIVLLGFIWYDEKRNVRIVQFVFTCVVLAILLLHCLCGGELGNVLILGVVSLVMLLVAAIRNHKEYAIVSSVTLVLMVLYITREFWLSIAWWVYLFVAGVVLVALAIKKEKEV